MMNIVSQKKLGIPQSRADSFQILCDFGIISQSLADRMKAMVEFRNRAIHDYQTLNLEIVQRIIEEDLDDFLTHFPYPNLANINITTRAPCKLYNTIQLSISNMV